MSAESVTYESAIVGIETIAPATRCFYLERPTALSFLPGQFLSFLLPVGGATLTKPYTLASSPEDPGPLQIVLHRIEGGQGSGYLFGLNVGASLRFTGPWGSFTLKEAPPAECVFIAEGTGVAAIRPMLRRAMAAPLAHCLRLHQSAERSDSLLFRGEFEELARCQPHFEYEPLAAGNLEEVVARRYVAADQDRSRHFFLCGIGEVVTRLRDLLRRSGYERRAVQYEKW